MTKKSFIELVIDKVLIASLIATFSTAILFSYDLYSKSFDAAREQSRNFSSFALKSKDAILSSAAEVEVALNTIFYVFPDQSEKIEKSGKSDKSEDVVYKMYNNAVQLNSAVNVLAGFKLRSNDSKDAFAQSLVHAQRVNVQLRGLVFGSYDRKSNKLENVADLKAELAKIDKEESLFVVAFNAELAQALADEFKQFYEAYYSGVPWYAQPMFLFILSLTAFSMCLVVFFFLPSEVSSRSYGQSERGALENLPRRSINSVVQS